MLDTVPPAIVASAIPATAAEAPKNNVVAKPGAKDEIVHLDGIEVTGSKSKSILRDARTLLDKSELALRESLEGTGVAINPDFKKGEIRLNVKLFETDRWRGGVVAETDLGRKGLHAKLAVEVRKTFALKGGTPYEVLASYGMEDTSFQNIARGDGRWGGELGVRFYPTHFEHTWSVKNRIVGNGVIGPQRIALTGSVQTDGIFVARIESMVFHNDTFKITSGLQGATEPRYKGDNRLKATVKFGFTKEFSKKLWAKAGSIWDGLLGDGEKKNTK